MVNRFHNGIRFFGTRREEYVILKPYSRKEMANMDISSNPLAPYFYLHLHVIHELRVLVPFNSFKIDFLTTSMSPFLILPPMNRA